MNSRSIESPRSSTTRWRSADLPAARIQPPVTHRAGEQLHEETAHALAELRIERLGAAERKDRDRVGGDRVDALEQHAGDLLPQIVLRVSAVLVAESLIVFVHLAE